MILIFVILAVLLVGNFFVEEDLGSSSTSSSSSSYWPKSLEPKQDYYVVNVSLSTDSLSPTVVALQGLVARSKPIIYTIGMTPESGCAEDSSVVANPCFNTLKAYVDRTYGETPSCINECVANKSSWFTALSMFDSYYTHDGKLQFVEYQNGTQGSCSGTISSPVGCNNNPFFPMQYDMARTIAGIEDALPISSHQVQNVLNYFGAHNVEIDTEVIDNPCLTVSASNYEHSADGTILPVGPRLSCFQWLWKNYGIEKGASSTLLAVSNEGTVQPTDYYVEFKIFEFEFSCPGSDGPCSNEATSADLNWVNNTVLPSYPQGTPVVGHFGLDGEQNTVQMLSENNLYLTVTDEVPNLSFLSGFPTEDLTQSATPQTNYNSRDYYIMWLISGGDSLNLDTQTNWDYIFGINSTSGEYYVQQSVNGNPFVVNFEISAEEAQLSPPLLKAFYQEANESNAFLIAGSSGAGYVHPSSTNETAYGNHVKQFAVRYDNLSISSVIDNNATGGKGGYTEPMIETYLQDTRLNYAIYYDGAPPNNGPPYQINYTVGPGNYPYVFSDGSAAFTVTLRVPNGYLIRVGQSPSIESIAANIVYNMKNSVWYSADTPLPHFAIIVVNGGLYPDGSVMSSIYAIMKTMPPNFLSVRADQFFNLYEQATG